MGFTPQQVGAMSLWQFTACVDGYARAHSSGGAGMDDKTFDELSAMVDEAMAESASGASLPGHASG